MYSMVSYCIGLNCDNIKQHRSIKQQLVNFSDLCCFSLHFIIIVNVGSNIKLLFLFFVAYLGHLSNISQVNNVNLDSNMCCVSKKKKNQLTFEKKSTCFPKLKPWLPAWKC